MGALLRDYGNTNLAHKPDPTNHSARADHGLWYWKLIVYMQHEVALNYSLKRHMKQVLFGQVHVLLQHHALNVQYIDTVLTRLILFDLWEGNWAGYCTLVLYFHSPVACKNTATHPCNIQSYRLLTIKYTYIIYVYIYLYIYIPYSLPFDYKSPLLFATTCCGGIFISNVCHPQPHMVNLTRTKELQVSDE